jgi:catalase-peroxidase
MNQRAAPSPAARSVSRPALGGRNKDWWPNALDLKNPRQHSSLSDPMGEDFDYAEEFKTLDLAAVKRIFLTYD